jgi:2-keto-4-pentenoate hydratase/2-oxohepta-3-ene-1,7-dioic acid hydratase in catechol pathway
MKLISYLHDGQTRVGVLDTRDSTVRPLAIESGDLISVIESWTPERAESLLDAGIVLALDDLTILAPIPKPRRNIFCVGKNYRAHAREFANSGFDESLSLGEEIPSHPIFFTKPASSVVGPGAPINPHTSLTSALDYEAEIAVIIGRGGMNIAAEDAWQHVWGYTLINDVTARDLQKQHKQWFLGKSLDTFCPMGPWAVTLDEFDQTGLTIECWVNGELRQNATTDDLIFDIPTLISTLSAGITLEAGDIIATGTPVGVGLGFDPPRFLAPGDVVSVRANGLGTLTNPIAETSRVNV